MQMEGEFNKCLHGTFAEGLGFLNLFPCIHTINSEMSTARIIIEERGQEVSKA